jgi:hypothetical protein
MSIDQEALAPIADSTRWRKSFRKQDVVDLTTMHRGAEPFVFFGLDLSVSALYLLLAAAFPG